MVEDWNRYPFQKDETVLFDTNVWMKIFPRIANPQGKNTYADLLAKTLKVGTKVALDVLVLSEFVNAFSRREYKRYQEKCARGNLPVEGYKEFRNSAGYRSVAKDLSIAVKDLLQTPNLIKVDYNFSQINISQIASWLVSQDMDWNDRMIVETCKRNSWVLVTDDGDYLGAGIKVLTGNVTFLTKAHKYVPPIHLTIRGK